VFGFGILILFAGLRGFWRGTWLKCDYLFYSRVSYDGGSTLRTRDRRVAMFRASWSVYDANMDEFAYP
jgi:hypothetical protein